MISTPAASTSKLRMGNGANSTISGSQGGICRTEPPRSKPAFPAPSTISPSESVSVRGATTPSIEQIRSSNGTNKFSTPELRPATQGKVGANPPSSLRTPPVAARQYPPSSAWYVTGGNFNEPAPSYVTPIGSNLPSPPVSSVPSQQRSVRSNAPPPSTVQPSDNNVSKGTQNTGSNVTPRAMGGAQSWSSQQNYAGGWADGTQQQPAGIIIGVPPSGPFHFHYNQVDNRKLTINNNAPGQVTTNNNHVSNVDNSNHHNTNAPQANAYTSELTNCGNTHTNVKQKATSTRKSASSSGNSHRREALPPSESLPIRHRQYKREKHVSIGEWSGRSTTHETVPDDRPC